MLTNPQKVEAAKLFIDGMSARPQDEIIASPVNYVRNAVANAINAMDTALDTAVPAVLQAPNGALPLAHRRRLLRVMVEQVLEKLNG